MFFSNWSIAKKLILAFGCVLFALCLMTAVSLQSIAMINVASTQAQTAAKIVNSMDDLTKQMFDLSGQVRGYLLLQDPTMAKAARADQAGAQKILKTLRTQAVLPWQKDSVEAIARTVDGYVAEASDPELAAGGDPATLGQATALMRSGQNDQWMARFKAAIHDFETKEIAIQDTARTAKGRAISQASNALLGGAAFAVLASVLMGWMLTRQIAGPVAGMTAAMTRLASGDNSVTVPALGRKDEIGAMARSVVTFKDAAIAKAELEATALEQSWLAETERVRVEQERALAADQQALVVGALARGLEALSEGVLTYRLNEAFAPEYEKLRDDFNRAIAVLQDTIVTIARGIAAIRAGTDEIAQASDDLARRTEQQAAGLEETAAALDQVTATVKQTAGGADHANAAVSRTKTDAEQSGQVVHNAVEAMGLIESSSQQIGQIIGVIDEIAFQTNLLALNAGVEAARAGDAGRGFAVVAQEVRTLAQRSADAAKEIKGLIAASTTHVDEGVRLVGETGEALTRIVAQIRQIDGAVADIAASAREQSTGLHEVNLAVNQMDQVTQQNAAMVEQTTAASHALAHETEGLARLIERFQVEDAGYARRRDPGQAGRPLRASVR